MYGQIRMDFDNLKLERLCQKHFAGFETARFGIVAVRLFSGHELVLTVYAEDRLNHNTALPEKKFPVKKFKTEIKTLTEFFEVAQVFNFTVANPDYNIDAMEVTNR